MSSTNPLNLTNVLQPTTDAIAAEAPSEARSWLDRIGISASLLCAVHCIAAPFMLLLLPAAGSVWSHPAVHWVLAVLVVPLALWVLYNGYRKHGNRLTLIAASLGALLIVAGLISPMVHSQPVVQFSVPTFFDEPAGASACTDTCCPTITHDAANNASVIAMPPGGLLTLIGSVMLVLAHTSNLIACRCFVKAKACDTSGDKLCGCPA